MKFKYINLYDHCHLIIIKVLKYYLFLFIKYLKCNLLKIYHNYFIY